MAGLTFNNVYVLVEGTVIGGSLPGVPAGTYEVVDGDNVLDFSNDTFTVNVTVPGISVPPIEGLVYSGTNDDGDVYGTLEDVGEVLFTNTAYEAGANPPGPDDEVLVICFARGTLIRTPDGERAVETLGEGDLVETAGNGAQPIRWIGARALSAEQLRLTPALRPIRIRAGALGNSRDLWVSPEHRMMLSGWRAEVMFGEAELLVAAARLLNGESIVQDSGADGVEYFHILFDRHELIWAEGCLSESFNPTMRSVHAMDSAARTEVMTLFPELDGRSGALPMVRPTLSKWEASRYL